MTVMAGRLTSPFRQSFGFILFLILSFESIVWCQVPIGTAFSIKPGATDGGCANSLNQLNDIWDDCWSLVNSAIQLIQAAQSTNGAQALETFQAKELIFTFFGTRSATDYTRALLWYQQVQNFMNGQGLANPNNPQSFLAPALFCNSDWLQLQAWTTQLLNVQGQPVSYSDGSQVTIRNSQLYSQFDVRGNRPYWSSDLLAYLFDRNYPNGYCLDATALAGTQDSTDRTTMTLCPNSRVVSADAAYLRLGTQVNPNDNIQLYSCVPLTLFHEMFHAVETTAATPDYGPNWSGAARMMQLATRTANGIANNVAGASDAVLQNPESYTWLALAAWYFYDPNNLIFFQAGLAQHRELDP